jgi:hypothetical protein
VDKALVLENRRGIMERKRKMQRTGSHGGNTRFHVGSSSQGPIFQPGQQSGQPRVQAACQGFQTPQRQIQRPNFQSPRSTPPPPQRNNMHRILVLWDHAIVAVRVGTTLMGVQGSRQIRLQPQAQIRASTAMPTIVHLLWRGRIKLMLK